MDFVIASSLFRKDDEHFSTETKSTIKDVWTYVVGLLVTAVAVGMSWRCNAGESLASRVFFAAVAGLFGTLYIVYALIFNWGECKQAWR